MHLAICTACRNDKSVAVLVGRSARGVGAEGRLRLVPVQLATAMGPEMDDGRPAAGHGDRIAEDLGRLGPVAVLIGDQHGMYRLGPFDLGNCCPGFDGQAQRLRLFHQRTTAFGPRVEDGRDGQTSLRHGNRGAVSIIIVGDQYGAVAGADAVIDQIVAHSRGKHNTGNVIARKAERAFDGAGCGDNLARANAPEPVARATCGRRVIGQAFVAQNVAVVIDTSPLQARAQGDIGHRLERVHSLGHPCLNILAVDLTAVDRCAATPMRGLFDQQHLSAGLCGCER